MSDKNKESKDNFFSKLEENIMDKGKEVNLEIEKYQEQQVEKRRHTRYEFSGKVFVHSVDPSYSLKGDVHDINEIGGLGVYVEEDKVEVDHEVVIEFVGGVKVKPFNIKTRVVNVFDLDNGKKKIGLKIMQLSMVTLARIRDYIDEQEMSNTEWGK